MVSMQYNSKTSDKNILYYIFGGFYVEFTCISELKYVLVERHVGLQVAVERDSLAE